MTSAHPFNFDHFFDPPSQPEVTAAYRWHEAGEHKDDFRWWARRGCAECAELADDLTATVEIKFTLSDLEDARYWFERYGKDRFPKPKSDHDLVLLWALLDVGDYREVL